MVLRAAWKIIRNLLPLAFIAIAIYQWSIIGERTQHAFRMWRKYSASGDGYTTMSLDTLIFGYIVSIVAVFAALAAGRVVSGRGAKVLKLAAVMMGGGILWLSALLLSPFARVVK